MSDHSTGRRHGGRGRRVSRLLLAALPAGALLAPVAAAGPASAAPAPGATSTTAAAAIVPSTGDLRFNGGATPVGDVIRVVPAVRSTAGTVFLRTPLPTGSFQSRFTLFLHGGSTPPADGLAFVVQDDPRGPRAIGMAGSAHGFSGVAPSVAVDFNLYDFFDCNCPTNQVRLVENGDYGPTGYNGTALVTTDPGIPLYGERILVWIDYDASRHLLSVFLAPAPAAKPATPVLRHTVDLAALVGPSAYFGFAAATGALRATMDVRHWEIEPL